MRSKKKKYIPKNIANSQNRIPSSMSDRPTSAFEGKPYIVLKHFQPDHQCFSEWDKNQLSKFSNLVKKFKETSWATIIPRKMYHYDLIKNYNKKYFPFYNKISHELSKDLINTGLIHFGFNSGERIFGFRLDDAFYLLLLDKNHDIFK